MDAPRDASLDAPRDVPLDTSLDASLDAPRDVPLDASLDAFLDAPRDVPLDTLLAPRDTPLDVTRDAPVDASLAVLDPLAPSLAPPIDLDPTHYPSTVWITDALAKVKTTDTPGAEHWALLSSARNEFEDFQVHVRAADRVITGLSVAVTDLTDARSGTVIRAADHAVVFREAYQSVVTPSDLNCAVGNIPDALIPAVDPWMHEARNAFPATVPARETRSFWIELMIPPGTPSGWYTGTVAVNVSGVALATMPVRVKVWNFDLPATSSLPNFFAVSEMGMCAAATGGYDTCGRFPGAGANPDHGVELTHLLTARFLLDYRLTNAETPYAGTDLTDWAAFDALHSPLLDGTATTRLRGARMTSLAYVGRPHDYGLAQRWSAHARDRGWSDRLLYYHCDEPPAGCSFAAAALEERAVHALTPPLRTLLTTDIADLTANGMLADVDIVTVSVERMHSQDAPSQRAAYDGFLAQPGRRLWWYQDCGQHESCANGTSGPIQSTWPTYVLDASPVRNRAFQWLAHLYRVSGELYYAMDYCWTNPCGAGTTNPWSSVYAFGGQGDGTLLYPGLPSRIGGTTPSPLPTLRLQLLRAGMEDYEYLHALTAAGDGAFADAQVRSFVTNTYTFSNDPRALTAAREALGARLHSRSLR